MAKNTKNGFRIGMIKNRSQFYNKQTKRWMKRCTITGKLLGSNTQPFKNIRKEKSN